MKPCKRCGLNPKDFRNGFFLVGTICFVLGMMIGFYLVKLSGL